MAVRKLQKVSGPGLPAVLTTRQWKKLGRLDQGVGTAGHGSLAGLSRGQEGCGAGALDHLGALGSCWFGFPGQVGIQAWMLHA